LRFFSSHVFTDWFTSALFRSRAHPRAVRFLPVLD
jgi:hypothetical protein